MTLSYTDDEWTMHFDRARSKSSNGVGIMFSSRFDEILYYYFKLEFEATNIVVEYEALLLGLNVAKDLGIKILHIIGVIELVVFQFNGLTMLASMKV
jgi:ribonuclease HI